MAPLPLPGGDVTSVPSLAVPLLNTEYQWQEYPQVPRGHITASQQGVLGPTAPQDQGVNRGPGRPAPPAPSSRVGPRRSQTQASGALWWPNGAAHTAAGGCCQWHMGYSEGLSPWTAGATQARARPTMHPHTHSTSPKCHPSSVLTVPLARILISCLGLNVSRNGELTAQLISSWTTQKRPYSGLTCSLTALPLPAAAPSEGLIIVRLRHFLFIERSLCARPGPSTLIELSYYFSLRGF